MSVENVAKSIIEPVCGSTFDGLGVVATYSKRRATREEIIRLGQVTMAVAQELKATRDAERARGTIRAEGFADCITVTDSYSQLLTAIADRLRSGDNAWDGPQVEAGVAMIRLWYDKSHARRSNPND